MNKIRSMVLVSGDSTSLQRGAREVYDRLRAEIKAHGLEQEISTVLIGDVGQIESLPVMIIYPEAVVYGPVTPEIVPQLVEEHLINGQVVTGHLLPAHEMVGKLALLSARKGTLPAEQRIVLRRVGVIDPTNIEEYIQHDGYRALIRTLKELTPAQIIDEIKKSGLRGRGGAGFPTGTKWGFVAKENSTKKYVVCNADESEPGTFKDRTIMEGDPHSIIEAMVIAGYAVGADEGYIYIRGEYKLAAERLKIAILPAKEMGFLGNNILGTGFNFELHLHSGAGAYICGEETALLESIEGRRGQPRIRPPYPTTFGLWGKPTLVNNVETLANVPPIVLNGATWYRGFGTASSPGTKVYSILGNVNNRGLIEVPMGITLREVIAIYAKGLKDGKNFKLAQTGGSSGSIIPPSLQDTPMDFDSYTRAGVSLGSGALLICDEDTCVVDLGKVLLQFFRYESCGKCFPCRIGTQRAWEMLDSISRGQATLKTLDQLLDLSKNLYETSNCGLGQTAGSPLNDILTYFRAEVEAHIRLGVCPAGVCKMREVVR
jgi:NADP-reducing hydrogenase subunit HndC